MTTEELKQRSIEIQEAFKEFKKEIEDQIETNFKKQEEITEVYHKAAALGDIRENAEYSSAEKDLAMCNATLASLSKQLKSINDFVNDENYFPMGMIVMYSTVCIESEDKTKSFVYRLYPAGVSDLSRGILDVSSPLGQALWLKECGDTFVLEHRVSGEPIRWTIKAVY